MGDKTRIEWTDATWNPIVGCSVISPGCTNCYAMKWAHLRLDGSVSAPHYKDTTQPSKSGGVWTGHVAMAPDHIVEAPLRWKKPRLIFVNSMGDLFHESVRDEWIARAFIVMEKAPQHTFQVLTKRAERMRRYMIGATPLPNVWLGVSAEDQQRADERIPHLLATPAAVRFVSAEPLLGPIDFSLMQYTEIKEHDRGTVLATRRSRLDWVIVGGESGPGARPMNPDWARSIRDQCAAAGVAYHFKQWGEYAPDDSGFPSFSKTTINFGGEIMNRVGKKKAGRLLDGREHNEMPGMA